MTELSTNGEMAAATQYLAIAPINVLNAPFDCWKCGQSTMVSCLSAHDFDDGYGSLNDLWDSQEDRGYLLKHIKRLPAQLLDALVARNANLRVMELQEPERIYLANACQHCEALQDDVFLHDIASGPFATRQQPAGFDVLNLVTEGTFPVDCAYPS